MGRFTGGNNIEVSTENYSPPSLDQGQLDLLEKLHNELWLMRKDLSDEQDTVMTHLVELGLAYIPKVIDLEQETPDYGITEKGKAVYFARSMDNGFKSFLK